jgi:putative serine protease PepD
MSEHDVNEPRPAEEPRSESSAFDDGTAASSGWRPATEPPATDGSTADGSTTDGSTADGSTASFPTAGHSAPSYPTPSYPTPSYPTPSYQPGYAPPGYPGGYPTASYPISGAGSAAAGAAAAGAAVGGYASQPAPGHPGYPYQGHPAQPQPPKRRIGAKVAGGVLVAALMVGSGALGAALVDKGGNTTTTRVVNGTVVDNAPIIDRSSLAGIAAAVSPSVVSITTSNAEGSGVILSADGYILTNNHVAVTAQGQKVDVTFSNGNTVKASLVGTDPKTDLAVFKAEGFTDKLTVAKFGNSSALQVGDTVLAIGSPLGLNGSVSEGIVSALNRTISESADSQPQDPFSQNSQQQAAGPTIAGAIQTDAAINPGNSGGALVNMNGEVVGINTAILTSGSGSEGSIGVGFAIPSNRAKEVADDLIKGVKVSHPYLGIGVATADGNGGALVKTVTAGSPAATAGIKEGDLITAIDGQAVHTSDDLINAVQAGKVGASVALNVTRDGKSSTVNVTLGESK